MAQNKEVLSPTSVNLLDAGSDTDDSSAGAFEDSRATNYLTPSQKIIRSLPKPKTDEVKPFSILGGLEKAVGAFGDITGGIIEAPRQIVGGVVDAFQEIKLL